MNVPQATAEGPGRALAVHAFLRFLCVLAAALAAFPHGPSVSGKGATASCSPSWVEVGDFSPQLARKSPKQGCRGHTGHPVTYINSNI